MFKQNIVCVQTLKSIEPLAMYEIIMLSKIMPRQSIEYLAFL